MRIFFLHRKSIAKTLTRLTWLKVQQLLALVFVAQSRAPGWKSYETYVWRLNRTHVALVMAMSPAAT